MNLLAAGCLAILFLSRGIACVDTAEANDALLDIRASFERFAVIGVYIYAPTVQDAQRATITPAPWIDITLTNTGAARRDAEWVWMVVDIDGVEYLRIPAGAPPVGTSRTVRIGLPLGLGAEP